MNTIYIYIYIYETDLRRDFNEFSRGVNGNLTSEIPAFRPKSTWKPPAGDPCVELFLSKIEHELFLFCRGNPKVIT